MKKQTKKFQHEKIVECKLCNKSINTDEDLWVALIDYERKKQIATGFYHRDCLDDLMKGKGEIIRKKFEERLGKFVKEIFSKIGIQNTMFKMGTEQFV